MDRHKLNYFITVFMAISAIFLPFWVTALAFVAGTILFENFYAGIIILFVMDAVYGFETFRVGPFYGLLTVSGILLLLLMKAVKSRTALIRR